MSPIADIRCVVKHAKWPNMYGNIEETVVHKTSNPKVTGSNSDYKKNHNEFSIEQIRSVILHFQ